MFQQPVYVDVVELEKDKKKKKRFCDCWVNVPELAQTVTPNQFVMGNSTLSCVGGLSLAELAKKKKKVLLNERLLATD